MLHALFSLFHIKVTQMDDNWIFNIKQDIIYTIKWQYYGWSSRHNNTFISRYFIGINTFIFQGYGIFHADLNQILPCNAAKYRIIRCSNEPVPGNKENIWPAPLGNAATIVYKKCLISFLKCKFLFYSGPEPVVNDLYPGISSFCMKKYSFNSFQVLNWWGVNRFNII